MRTLCFAMTVTLGAALGCGDDDGAAPDCTRMVCAADGGGADSGGSGIDSGGVGTDGAIAMGDGGGGGTDAGALADSGGTSDAAVECVGVHPVIGPPRTCERGSCLCVGSDTCFTADVARACCEGELTCAPAPESCMGTHPIIGPPRTCESGACYCANPDACFAPERAEACCAVEVVCVP